MYFSFSAFDSARNVSEAADCNPRGITGQSTSCGRFLLDSCFVSETPDLFPYIAVANIFAVRLWEAYEMLPSDDERRKMLAEIVCGNER